MPDSNEQRAEFEAFQKMAADADQKGLDADANIDLANYLAPSPAKTVPDTARETKVSPVEVPDETKTNTEPARAETETVDEGEEVETEEIEDTEEEETPEEELTPAERRLRKDQARLAKNFQDFQQEKTESREEMRRLREELAELRQQPRTAAEKDERGYTAEQYETYAEKAAEEGDVKTYKIALQEANILRQKEAYAQYETGWRKTQAEMVKEYPDLANMESPLYKEVSQFLDEPQSIFKTRHDGLKHAVAYAKAKLDTGSIPALKGEIRKLKQELTRLSELNSVPGDKPHRMSGVRPTSFDKMDAKDQLESLRRQARELDEMRTSG